MQTVETLNRKIATAKDLAGVVRTMKILAAVNIRQYESAEESLNAYIQTIRKSAEMAVWNDPSLHGIASRPCAAAHGVDRVRFRSGYVRRVQRCRGAGCRRIHE